MHNMNKVQMLEFPQQGDSRGHLVIVESGKDIPFDIKRAFYIYGSDSEVVRGQHANRRTQFVLITIMQTFTDMNCIFHENTGLYLLNTIPILPI